MTPFWPCTRPGLYRATTTAEGAVTMRRARPAYRHLSDAELIRLAYWGVSGTPAPQRAGPT